MQMSTLFSGHWQANHGTDADATMAASIAQY